MMTITETPADTTTHPEWVPVVVTAHLGTPAAGLDANPLHLDGPASWGAYQEYVATHGHTLPPITDETVTHFDLPIATWTIGGTWGWACSRAQYTPLGWSTSAMRRRPAVEAMARYTTSPKHHLAAGPAKARDTPIPVTLVAEVTWYALADPVRLRELLGRVWSLGRHGRHGHGRITRWTVEEHDDQHAWRDRIMPNTSGTWQGIRAPYHHPTCQVMAC